MRKNLFLKNTENYLGLMLIVSQCFLLTLLTILFLNKQYVNQWQAYPKSTDTLTVCLKNVPKEHESNIENYLYTECENKNLSLLRRDNSSDNEGNFSGLTFGIYGDVENNELSFNFYGKQLVHTTMLKKLISCENDKATLGIDKGSNHSIGNIPYLRFGEKVVFKKMQSLIKDSNTINGTYMINGLDKNEVDGFLNNLSIISNISKDKLINKSQGSSLEDSLKITFTIIFILAQILINIIFFIIITMKNLTKGGSLALLGWSRKDFCFEILGRFVSMSLFNIPLQIIFGLLFCGLNTFSLSLIKHFTMNASINIFLIILELSFSIAIFMGCSSINAIKGKLPKKNLYFIGISAYVIVSIGIVLCSLYIDGPMKKIEENSALLENWSKVSNYQILKNLSYGSDEQSFQGSSNELDKSIFDWYKSISNKEGVYLIKGDYYSNELIESWKNNSTYNTIPKKAFWYMTFSPNYIKDLKIDVKNEILDEAINGTRVYLIPEDMDQEEKNNMKKYLFENSISNIKDGDIPTKFNKEKKIKTYTYSPKDDFFTWSTTSKEATKVKNPIIYVCTPENMKYFESESLKANDLNGYIKFKDSNTAQKYLTPETLDKYNLTDNQPTFTNVKDFIDGITKTLQNTLLWFGLIFFILLMLLLGILIALANVFRIVNQERINVKKFLGHGFFQLYKKPIIMLSSFIVIELIVTFVMRCKMGLFIVLINAIIQLIVFSVYMSRCEIKNILIAFKGE